MVSLMQLLLGSETGAGSEWDKSTGVSAEVLPGLVLLGLVRGHRLLFRSIRR